MAEIKEQNQESSDFSYYDEEESSLINIENILSIFILNWKWFILSIIIFMSGAYVYLRYTVPVYMATSKIMIKGEGGRRSIRSSENLGMMSVSEGINNEVELIKSRSIAHDVVKHLKLYTTYMLKGTVTDKLLYKNQPITVDIDEETLEGLVAPISLTITNNGGKYSCTGSYMVPSKGDQPAGVREINIVLPAVPTRLKTGIGDLTFLKNEEGATLLDGQTMFVTIVPSSVATGNYAYRLSAEPLSDASSIARLSYTDQSIQRAMDYLKQIVISYNEEANNDKNIVAARTEQFINNRLTKINAELGMTEGKIESFKRSHGVVDFDAAAGNAWSQTNSYDTQLAEMGTQVELLNQIEEYMNDPSNKYQTLPANVGISDQTASSLINNYNQIVLERIRLLRTANENSPSVILLTDQLKDLDISIRRAISQTRSNFRIRHNALMQQYSKYNAKVLQSPGQERILNQIGRQQEVRSGLYLMLLQKREENSISLAATADKGKQIDEPMPAGAISPDRNRILWMCFGASVLVPFVILLIIQLLRYKIEGRGDVERLTRIPVLADVPVASESAKSRADIVVHENKNNMMEEVFRSLRTNLQFTLKESEKTIVVTSSTSGEGKTFIAANVAVSFALLGKKVVLVGLDIRKPRLSDLFGLNERDKGITTLLMHDNPTKEQIHAEIVSSEVHPNLNLLLAGPTPPNPAEIVERHSLDVVFDLLKEEYDYVIVDTAPVGLVTDTIGISRVANATLLVCRADYTPKTAFGMFNELADTDKLPNPSIVINAVDLSKKKYGYYYGYGKYGKYGKYANYRSYNGYSNYSRYGGYGGYGTYGRYGRYGSYGNYGRYGSYGQYGAYSSSHYSEKDDDSIKK